MCLFVALGLCEYVSDFLLFLLFLFRVSFAFKRKKEYEAGQVDQGQVGKGGKRIYFMFMFYEKKLRKYFFKRKSKQ